MHEFLLHLVCPDMTHASVYQKQCVKFLNPYWLYFSPSAVQASSQDFDKLGISYSSDLSKMMLEHQYTMFYVIVLEASRCFRPLQNLF